MKKSTYLILLMVICIGVKWQDTVHVMRYKTFDGLDSLVLLDSLREPTADNPIKYRFVQVYEDSSVYYQYKYRYFLYKKTNAQSYKDILRYSDSLLKYAELINRKK